MATKAYTDWLADGSPWQDAKPVRAVGDILVAHGYTVYYHGDLRHLTADPPEDHTPFSATGWPAAAPYPVCNALDVMPPAAGQTSALTGRPLPSLASLAAQLRADVMNRTPGGLWVKYMNWEPGDGNCWHDSWQPDYARRSSTDRGHLHVSGRSDMTAYTRATGYDLVARTEGSGMPLWGWDASHYDAVPDPARVYGEGFRFMTHKIGGDANDAEAAAWWTAMRGWRDRILLGGYWVLYPGNPVTRANAFAARLDTVCPGWRDGPFILQLDAEIWGGDTSTKPTVAECNTFADRLTAIAPKLRPVGYLPRWVYGNDVSGFRYPLWASAYVTGSGPASTLYPGDNASQWNAYGGKTPDILQFTSSATIVGQTTCDANAYRGTLGQLTALVAPGWINTMATLDSDDINSVAAATEARIFAHLVTDFADTANPKRQLSFGTWTGYSEARAQVTALMTLLKQVQATSAVYQQALLSAITAADDGAAVVAAVDQRVQELMDEMHALDTADAARQTETLEQVLAAIDQITSDGPVSSDQLKQALREVFAEAFSQPAAARHIASTLGTEPGQQPGILDIDAATRAAREEQQRHILEGEGQ